MSRSYLDKEKQHILTHTKDNRVNSFIANVNELVRHIDSLLYANTIFNQDVVDVLREALETDFTELLKDLKKGNHLGNRQLDINLLKNMSKWNEYLTEEEQKNIWLDEGELVYYDSALVKFIDGTTHRIIFQFDGVEGPITTHGDLLLQLNNDEEFLARLEKTSANTFPAKVVGEYLKLYDELGQNSNVEGVELNAVSGKYKEKNPYYYWIATTSALQVLAMRSTEIIKLGEHIDKVVSLALNVDQMLELQNRLPQLVDTYNEEGNPKGDVTIYNHLTELLEIYGKLDYLLDVVNLAEAAENSANMAEQFADEALTRLNKIQSIKVGRTITTTPNNEAVVFYNSDSNEFTFTVPKGEKGDRGEPFQVNASGAMEQRALYDDRPKGFSFLCIDTSEVFFRKSDTHADWTVGVPFGKGDKGDKGDKGEDGRTPELSDSIDSASSLTAASSKAVKTVNDKLSIASPEMKGLVNSGGNNGELFGTVENRYKMIPRVELLASATLAGLVPTFSGNNLNLIVNDRGEMEWREANSLINATNEPTPNTVMCRDEEARVRVEDPVHDKDVVNKVYVDSAINIGSNGAYGLKWNQEIDVYQKLGATNRTQIQKNMKRCVLNSDGTVNYYLDPFNSTLKADGTTAILTGADGNIMVEVPKFWYKHELNGNEHQWWVSPTSLAGYNVHPWFLEGGVEHDFRYYRAYTCINQGGVLRSVSGVTPTRNQTRNTFRAQARANGAGWNLCSWNAVNAIQILYLTEYCTLDSQSVLGSGNDTGQDYGTTTGQSNVIGNASSGPLNNNTWMSYRGVENFYADCWEFVDGINVQNYKVFLNQNPDTFADGVFTGGYEDSGVTVPAATANYVKKISGNFLPTALGGSSSTYVTDGFWSNTGNRIALFGGSAYNGALVGAFCLRVDHAASHVDVNGGAGLSR